MTAHIFNELFKASETIDELVAGTITPTRCSAIEQESKMLYEVLGVYLSSLANSMRTAYAAPIVPPYTPREPRAPEQLIYEPVRNKAA